MRIISRAEHGKFSTSKKEDSTEASCGQVVVSSYCECTDGCSALAIDTTGAKNIETKHMAGNSIPACP